MKLKSTLLGIFFLFLISLAQAQSTCPDRRALLRLKGNIDSSRFNTKGKQDYRFPYTKTIIDAACAINIKDTQLIKRRVALMWQMLTSEPVALDLSLKLKDLLRYAIKKRYQPFMLAAATSLHLNLNETTEDGQTLLQYLEEEIGTEPDSNIVRMLREYYALYVERGALHFQHLSFMTRRLTERFDGVKPYAYGHYAVREGQRWGFVNHRGETVIPLQYKEVRYYLEDIFEVSKDGVNFYFVDGKNQRVTSPWN